MLSISRLVTSDTIDPTEDVFAYEGLELQEGILVKTKAKKPSRI
jgi:hypothetical protein